jgi:prevent-host-death family protein
MQISATEVRKRFGHYLLQAEREPVHVIKNDRTVAVIVSAARFAELEALALKKSRSLHKGEFDKTYKDWIAAQHDLVERIGVFGEEFRPW